MGLMQKISDLRAEHILDHARSHLDDDEEVIRWVRARTVGERKTRTGFVFLTERHCVVAWSGREADHDRALGWTDISAWGVADWDRGGPVLGVETVEGSLFVQLPVGTERMASNVSDFLKEFSRLAAPAKGSMASVDGARTMRASEGEITRRRRSIIEMTRRIVVTVIGVVMVVGGILITPLPGPWSFPIVLGGLAVLASEYDWASDLLAWVRKKWKSAAQKIKSRRRAPD